MIGLVTYELVIHTGKINEPVHALGLLHKCPDFFYPFCIGWAVELPRGNGKCIKDLEGNPVDMVGTVCATTGVVGEILLNERLHLEIWGGFSSSKLTNPFWRSPRKTDFLNRVCLQDNGSSRQTSAVKLHWFEV
jgi:hypothetical protein